MADRSAEVSLMTTRETIIDAGGDIAALVYADQDRPDLVLCAFARRLADAGRRVCGLIQFRDRPVDGSACRLMVLEGWHMVEMARQHDGADDHHCRLDAHWLDQTGTEVGASIRRGVDAVIVNRFGPLEAAGRGFCAAILTASETETPLVIAVPVFEFERWTRFSAGMAVRLDCSLDSVQGWWRTVSSRAASLPACDTRACALFK